MPKICLLYYKNILDRVFKRFFELYNDDFQNIDGQYVLARSMSRSKLQGIFKQLLYDELAEIVKPYDVLNPQYFFIIGACMPQDNILLEFRSKNYFPAKLDTILSAEYQYKYFIREHDIKIDLVKFNQACIELFNYMFKHGLQNAKQFGKSYSNVIFIQHKHLDCYAMFKTIKYLVGKSNCINLYLEKFKKEKSPIIAVNDLIDLYSNKLEMNKSKKFMLAIAEVKTFIDERLRLNG